MHILDTSFTSAKKHIVEMFKNDTRTIHTEKWQGIDISKKPEARMQEFINYSFSVALGHEDLDTYRKDIKPNLPWADDHFKERVGGEPINPGEQWKHWPWGNSADNFRDLEGKFNHNYMERYWPKHANQDPKELFINEGIRFNYGDIRDLIQLLRNEPHTRQAYIPIFFPEDTGAVHGGRVPCSLGYHFIKRNGALHINYYLRSCEVYRHFRDDCYLTVRLLLWVLDELRKLDSSWNEVTPGIYTMHITSFHCFVNDMRSIDEL